jgi:glycerol uptake facilitator-like aquaporin
MIELVAGAILIAGTLAWSRWSDTGKLVPGLLLVLGVGLVVGGVTGS